MQFKTSIAVEALNGSAGNVTAARNKSKAYFKIRTAPRNPRTTYQLKARSNVTEYSKNWAKLTEVQRTTWEEFAKTQTGRRILGTAGKLNGLNAYTRVNTNLKIAGLKTVVVPPVPHDIPQVIEMKLTNSTTGVVSLNVTLSVPPVDKAGVLTAEYAGVIIVRATPILSNGLASKKSALRFMIKKSLNGSAVAPVFTKAETIELSAAFQARFGQTLQETSKIEIEVKYVTDYADSEGLSSMKYDQTLIVPAKDKV